MLKYLSSTHAATYYIYILYIVTKCKGYATMYLVSLLCSSSLHPHKWITQSVKTSASGAVVMGDADTV